MDTRPCQYPQRQALKPRGIWGEMVLPMRATFIHRVCERPCKLFTIPPFSILFFSAAIL